MEKEDAETKYPGLQAAERNADPGLDLAVERTELALERTQLAWIRTTLSFLGVGVALDKGIEAIHNARIETGNALIENAHVIGISLSISGTVLMLVTTASYIQRSLRLAKMRRITPQRYLPGAVASVIITLLGAVLCFLLFVS